MISPDSLVLLRNGDGLTAREVMEGLVALAKRESPFPLLTEQDITKAVIAVAIEARDWAGEEGLLE